MVAENTIKPTADQSTVDKETSNENSLLQKYSELIRPCSVYKEEYKECKSIRGRFNQHFVFGETLNCDQWRDDYNNCQKYSWLNNKEAAELLIQSEINRRAVRMKAHYDNDIWTKRESPPEDWSKPLPEFMQGRNQNTYLGEMAQMMKKEEEQGLKQNTTNALPEANKSSFCTFM